MTSQEIFNKVCEHLMTQKAKAVIQEENESVPTCMYRTPEGLKCAVGGLIPDEMYNPVIEGKPFNLMGLDDCPELNGIAQKLGLIEDIDLIHRLQRIHDSDRIEDWSKRLRRVGENHDLEIPKCLLTTQDSVL